MDCQWLKVLPPVPLFYIDCWGQVCCLQFWTPWQKNDLQTLPYIENLAYTFNNVMLQGLSWLLGLQLRLLTKLSFHHSRPITVLITLAATPICMSISVLPSLMNKIPRYWNSAAWGCASLPAQSGLFGLSSRLRFGGADLHPSCEPFECLRPKEPHHPQTVTRSSGHDRSSYASAPTNPAYKNEKQYWWQRLALMEANSHHKRVRLTACIQKHREEIKKLVHFPRAWMKTPLILTVPFTPSVQSPSGYEGCLAAKNLQPQLATAALTMTQGNKSHLDSISVTSLKTQMMFRWWKMTIKRFVCQAFPADPHYLCLPGLSSPLNLSQHLFNLVPGGDQLASLHLPSLSLNCPANTAADLMRSLQSWSLIFDQGCPGGKCTSSNQHSSPPREHCSDLTEMPDAHQ